MRSLPLVLLASLFFAASNAQADWNVDPGPSGLQVATNVYRPCAVISDRAGGVFIGFSYYGGGHSISSVYLQRIDSQGSLPWGAEGVAFGSVEGILDNYGPMVVPDGAGGAVGVWRAPTSTENLVLGQRITSNGSVIWPRLFAGDGVHLSGTASSKFTWWLTQDGTGGFIATWLDSRLPAYGWMAQRTDINGTLLWGSQGIGLGFISNHGPALASDGAGGLIAFWSATGPSGDLDLYAERYGSDGSTLWAPGGVPICSASGDQGNSWIFAVPDGAGGATVAWTDTRADTAGDIYAQRVDASGAVQWGPTGVAICAVPGAEKPFSVVRDGTGGLIAVWEDARTAASTGVDLYGQRVGGDGVVRWTSNGAIVCDALGDQIIDVDSTFPSCIAPDENGGVFVAWSDGRPDASYGNDIFAQHLDGSGTPIWPVQGLRFGSSTTTPLHDASVVPDASGGCVVLWGGEIRNLYARGSSGLVTGVGTLGSAALLLRGTRPNPTSGPFSVDFSLAERGTVHLEIFDVTSRLVWRQDAGPLDPGPHVLRVGALRPGLYCVRLRQAARSAVTHAIILR
jgi:hypothetical protein